MTRLDTISVGRDQFRVGPWHGSPEVAYVALPPTVLKPSPDGVVGMLERLRSSGYQRAITSALREPEVQPFIASGFGERERLAILSHELVGLHDLSRARSAARRSIRRPRPGERADVLEIDAAAFELGWRLDRDGLVDALSATPRSRFRVAEQDNRLVAYAVCGRAGDMGYLQRLAVDPTVQRCGIGRALVTDSLGWLQRRGARRALVNTQQSNLGAMRLYEHCGFRREQQELIVLEMAL